MSFHTGIEEVCLCLNDVQTDDYITGLVQEVKDANQRLFDALNVGKAKHNVQQGSYGKPLTRMDMDTQMTVVKVLLHDLSKPKMQAHAEKLPLLPDRINGIQVALDTLLDKRLEVDRAKSRVVKHKPLSVLKREVNEKLEVLITYLQAMASKEPEAYGKPYAVVTAIITRLNASYTGGAPKASKKQADAEGSSEAQRVAMGA